METFGKIIASGTVRFQRLLPGSVEKIWAYLTESEKRGKWLAPGELEPRVGGKVTLIFRHQDLSPEKETVPERYQSYTDGATMEGQVTQWDPPHTLAYTWGESSEDFSEVIFELEAKGEHTLLTLTHRKLGADREVNISVSSGWHTHLGILTDHLAGQTPKGFWKVHLEVEKEYARMLK